MFKVGDKVVRTGPEYKQYNMYCNQVYTVKRVMNNTSCLEVVEADGLWLPEFFLLYTGGR